MKHLNGIVQWRRGVSWLIVILGFVPCMCLTFPVSVTFQAEAATRPGMKNPLAKPSRRTLFPDHEILTFSPTYVPNDGIVSPGSTSAGFGLDQGLSAFSLITTQPSFALSTPQVSAATGRIVKEETDQVVHAQRTGNRVGVFLLRPDSSKRVRSASLPRFAVRPGGGPELLDVAVGDLDNLADARGRNHDEVVVCYATTTAEADRLAVMVAVIDYTDRSASKPLIKRVRSSTPIDKTSFSDTWGRIRPVDSVISCAVGDLNGDGQNEIAVAHLENALEFG